MRKSLLVVFLLIEMTAFGQTSYTPATENLTARKIFQDNKFGLFIHWGLSSVLGNGEWVMNNRRIKIEDYRRYLRVFNPVDFDAEKWVLAAKNAGMKYIVFITRHHDGFSNWDTKYSDWKITNTPYGKDVLKMLAEACQKHEMKLGLYYSTLDWYRSDYPYETGRTGQYSGRTEKSNYASYLQFMKNQLTELLTNYGTIMSIWLDGHWDQTNPEGHADRSSRIDWKYEELYGLIHQLQPACMIGNNHHLDPIAGEDFQMFEKDLPGENKSGLSFQQPSDAMPLETCETMNDSWGYNITDRNYKTVKQVIQMLVNTAGRNANLLLNVGPMPNGEIQKEFIDTLAAAGKWLQQFGNSIYNTRGKIMPPQPWGVVTRNGKEIFLHLLRKPENDFILLPGFTETLLSAEIMKSGQKITWNKVKEGVFIYPMFNNDESNDHLIKLVVK
ncbi:MAG TPA: alpha-L-fucosidase [Chitinophagaceae bacterium]|nr:alpha-L-fucosidase [Chitinophagaceae bacterium]